VRFQGVVDALNDTPMSGRRQQCGGAETLGGKTMAADRARCVVEASVAITKEISEAGSDRTYK